MQTYSGPPASWVAESARLPLVQALWQAFGKTAALLPSPALTGRHLLSLSREMEHYPPLPPDVQRLIRANSGQGRVEVTTDPCYQTIPAFHYLDMRLAYAASCESLPCGEWQHVRGSFPFDRYRKGRYRVEYRVPRDWGHVGLFMEKDVLGWKFPSSPGYTGETWASNGELALASDYGWAFQIKEAILFAGPSRGRPAPLDAWIQRLTRIHEAGNAEIQAAVRQIILHTIGAFHSAGREETVIVEAEMAATIPPRAVVHLRADGRLQYKRYVPLPAHLQPYMHPEWSAEIWARCRTRLLRFQRIRGREVTDAWGALTVPRAHVLGFRTDALYLTRAPGWRDYGELGNFRLKGSVLDERPAPRTLDALYALRKEAERENGD